MNTIQLDRCCFVLVREWWNHKLAWSFTSQSQIGYNTRNRMNRERCNARRRRKKELRPRSQASIRDWQNTSSHHASAHNCSKQQISFDCNKHALTLKTWTDAHHHPRRRRQSNCCIVRSLKLKSYYTNQYMMTLLPFLGGKSNQKMNKINSPFDTDQTKV